MGSHARALTVAQRDGVVCDKKKDPEAELASTYELSRCVTYIDVAWYHDHPNKPIGI